MRLEYFILNTLFPSSEFEKNMVLIPYYNICIIQKNEIKKRMHAKKRLPYSFATGVSRTSTF